MPRKYSPGKKRKYGYSSGALQEAMKAVRTGQMTLRDAASQYGITRGTLSNKLRSKHDSGVGRPTCLTSSEEEVIVSHLLQMGSWGFPCSTMDLRLIVKSYLDKNEVTERRFKANLPGKEWAHSFMDRHADSLKVRTCQNLDPKKGEVSKDDIDGFFDRYENTIEGVPVTNIHNYDETNLTDNPGIRKCIFKRGVKYPERIMASNKTAISLMYCASADGTVLPPYVVYKADHMWDSWCTGASPGTRFNRTQSGWFDGTTFIDWFKNLYLPSIQHLIGPKVLIGDNLSSHFSTEVLKVAADNDVHFVCLPPNSTQILQPLDVAFFGPMKTRWRELLTEWKTAHSGAATLKKSSFPALLKKLHESLVSENAISGFRKTGLYPPDRTQALSRLPEHKENRDISFVSETVTDLLKAMRNPEEPNKKRRRVPVSPGKSISVEDVASNLQKTAAKSTKKDNGNRMTQTAKENTEVNGGDEWESILKRMEAKTFTSLKNIVEVFGIPLAEKPLTEETHSIFSTESQIDNHALSLRPDDAPEHLFPVITVADGNCLPRSLSKLIYGTEDRHPEIRARIIIEAVSNMESYLDNSYLKNGANIKHRKASTLQVIASFSPVLEPTMNFPLTTPDIRKIYQNEVLHICKPGSYCGLWQLFQASNAFKINLFSHYPERTNVSVRADANRVMKPRDPSSIDAHVMWTTLESSPRTRPNHFVPLMPINAQSRVEVLEEGSAKHDAQPQLIDDDEPITDLSISESVMADLLTQSLNCSPSTDTLQNLDVGTYVLISHGQDELPACVVRAQADPAGLAVRFYDAVAGGYHAPQEATYAAVICDVIRVLDVPEVVQESRGRFSFKFKL